MPPAMSRNFRTRTVQEAWNDGVNIGSSYPTAAEADVRNILKREDPTIGFIGFVRPSFGAYAHHCPTLQAQLWYSTLVAPQARPPALARR